MALTEAEQRELDELIQLDQPTGLTAEEEAELQELLALEGGASSGGQAATYDPMQTLEDALRGGAQGLTMGHLPQIQAGIETLSTSGPAYEASKQAVRQDIDEARERSGPLAVGTELVGSMIVPGALFPKVVGAARSAALGAGMAGAQNPGGDLTLENLKDRLKSALAGGAIGGVLGKLQTALGPAAERRAFSALGPTKRDIVTGRSKGNIQDIGRTMLHEKIIRNIPRSKETLYQRADEVADAIGARKSEVINALDEQAVELGYMNLDDLKSKILGLVESRVDPNHPSFQNIKTGAKEFVDRMGARANRVYDPYSAPGKDMYLSLKQADDLKTSTGRFVKWLRQNPNVDQETKEFNRTLYGVLNDAVDKKATHLTESTVLKNPFLKTELNYTKKAYGDLSDAKRILDNKISAEESARITPSDAGIGILGGLAPLVGGSSPGASLAIGVGLGAANKFRRTYGSQVMAKQLDNASRLLNKRRPYNAFTFGAYPGALGAYDRITSPWSLMPSTKD